ncbi:Sphingomyelin phosphodiesterase [Entamoeba marina]
MIFGHIHTDQFRILPQQQPQCILIGNSLSPVYGNTVGYRIYYTISNKYKGFLDYIQYNFDLSNSNLQKHPIWFPSYSFTSKFNVFDVSINSFLNIFSNVHFDSSSLVNSKTNGFSHGDDPMFWCSITSPTNTEFMKCIDDCNEE